MKKWLFVLFATNLLLLSIYDVHAQRSSKRPAPARSIVFAVLNDGAMLEPIALVANRKLSAPVNGSDPKSAITAFNRMYYKPGTQYKLVFGGVNGGSVTVKGSDASSECAKNMATVTTKASKTPLRGLVMGLATNAAVKTTAGVRRKPTAAEKDDHRPTAQLLLRLLPRLEPGATEAPAVGVATVGGEAVPADGEELVELRKTLVELHRQVDRLVAESRLNERKLRALRDEMEMLKAIDLELPAVPTEEPPRR